MNYELVGEINDKLLKIQAFEELGDLATRQKLIYQLVSISHYAGLEGGYRPVGDSTGQVTGNIPEWAGPIVAYLILPTGEVSYFLQPHTSDWQGYSRAEKLERIRKFITGQYPVPTEEDGLL